MKIKLPLPGYSHPMPSIQPPIPEISKNMRNESLEVCHRFLDLLDRDINTLEKVYEKHNNEFNRGCLAQAKRVHSNLIVAEWCINGNHGSCWYDDKTCSEKDEPHVAM